MDNKSFQVLVGEDRFWNLLFSSEFIYFSKYQLKSDDAQKLQFFRNNIQLRCFGIFHQKVYLYLSNIEMAREHISDFETGLEWVVGPDKTTNCAQAHKWAASCKTAGGGWRMPKLKELKTLYQKGIVENNMDPVFKTTGWIVCSAPSQAPFVWGFNFWSGSGEGVYYRPPGTSESLRCAPVNDIRFLRYLIYENLIP